MKLSQLEALIAIADGQGIAGAAEKLNISQPAITKSLSNLEHELGVDLLDRSEYRLKLNAYGERLLLHARAIAAESEKAITDIQIMREKDQQLIRVNGSPGSMPKLIPLALQRARKEIPGLLIEFEGHLIGSPDSKYRGLSEGLYDLLLYPVEEQHEVEDFICEPLMDVRLVILASKNHPALQLHNPTLKDLCHFDWLSPSKSGLPHRLVKSAFAAADAKFPDTMLPLPMLEMTYSFLRHGEYLAFFPFHPAIAESDMEFDVINADIPPLNWNLHLIQRKTSNPSEGMLAFIKALREVVTMAEQGQL